MAKPPVDLGRVDPTCTARWHGTRSAYTTARCRCPHAKEAKRLDDKRRKAGLHVPRVVDATGTARRLQALQAIGWSCRDIAARLGCTPQAVQQWANMACPTVQRRTAADVVALCHRLVALPLPTGRNATYARTVARKNGWHSFAAWDDIDDPDARPDLGDLGEDIVDEVAVRRALAGQMTYSQLRQPERVEAYRRLVAAGAGPAAIRRRLNINGFVLMRLEALARQEQTGEACEVAA